MPSCAVFVCKKRSETSNLEKDGITFHIFPKHEELRKLWTKACNKHKSWTPTRTSCVCSRHFEAAQFVDMPNKRRRLTYNAIPTLFLTNDDETSAPRTSEQQPSCAANISNKLTPREQLLLQRIKLQSKKIKRLHAKILYLKNKLGEKGITYEEKEGATKATKKKAKERS